MIRTNFNVNMKKLQYKLNIYKPLTQELKEITIGLLLGDLHLSINKSGSCYLKFEQGNIHYEYLIHLYNLFKIYVNTGPKDKIRKLNNKNNKIISWYFNTTTVEAFKEFKTFYKNNRKIVPKNIEKLLTPRGLSYWFMDDGGKLDYTSNSGKGIQFNTHSFTKLEVEQMSLELHEKFNLNCWVKLNKNKYVIAISGKSYNQFIKLINPYIIDSMRKKLPSPRIRY